MISAPGAAMLDSKLFVSRFDDPFPDLYERFWDGVEWIWVNHGRPDGIKMKGAPGAAMLDEKLFVVVDDGALWERQWRSDLERWAWENHGRPENKRIAYGPGAAMLNEKLFVVTEDGDLWERNWRSDLDRWAWENHGRPESRRIVAEPGAAMMNEKLFVVTEDGDLWERHWRSDLNRWAWQGHGRPESKRIVTAPGAAMLDEKLFVVTEDGDLWERHWRNDLGRWAWEGHGRPGGNRLKTAPGAAMLNEKLFVGGDDGHLYERQWREDLGRWAWQDHGRPPGAGVASTPGAAMMNSKLFVAGDNRHLFERVWTGDAWKWVDHGTAYHDQSAHVIGAPGTDPKLTIAVMGDGYAEDDMDDYRRLVRDKVVAAFNLDQLGAHKSGVRVIRIDVVSPVSGVSTRDYDEHGTTADASDDTLTSENFRFSRLGYISTGIWSHCWIETTPALTESRVDHLRQRFAPDATNVIVMVNDGRSGGCNRGNIAAFTRGERAQVIAHELGHNLFGLGDEYNEGTRAFTGVAGPPNLSEEPADWSLLKWGDLVAAGTPLPTSPGALPGGWNDNTSVGAFEGGGANFSTGIFRPVIRCRMNQNDPPWCPVCGRQIDLVMGAF
jgi:hypothetical protein